MTKALLSPLLIAVCLLLLCPWDQDMTASLHPPPPSNQPIDNGMTYAGLAPRVKLRHVCLLICAVLYSLPMAMCFLCFGICAGLAGGLDFKPGVKK